MNTLINRQLFTQKTFDSGALGPMTSVIHQFARPGRYLASIRKQGSPVGTFSFFVDEKSETMQLDIDLATVTSRKAGAKADDCDCHSQALPVVSPKGYVIFFASGGSGYSVQAGNEESKEAEFDSEKLKEGDLFALTLLEPTRYSMVNQLADAKGEIG
ncbi:MAG: hypothetical protein HGB11_11925, partial [Chlorobiales bacterium]|nr:hypothetical protein [Chlorobiales bacterium]